MMQPTMASFLPPAISKLPDELLLEIMWLLVINAHLTRTRYRILHDDLPGRWGSILAVTQVCGHWRYLAISESRLWTFIDLTDEKTTQLCLERSGFAALRASGPRYRYTYCPFLDDAAFAAVCRVTERLASLDLRAWHSVMSVLVSALSNKSLPALEHLDLSLVQNVSHKDSCALFIDFSHAPRLKTLKLNGIYPMFSPNSLSGLRTLCISYQSYFPLDMEAFLIALGGTCSHLETLDITNAGPEFSKTHSTLDKPEHKPIPTSFPRLQHIHLDLPRDAHRLLNFIDPSPTTTMSICVRAPTLLDVLPPNILKCKASSLMQTDLKLEIEFIDLTRIVTLVLSDLRTPNSYPPLTLNVPGVLASEAETLQHVASIFGSSMSSCSLAIKTLVVTVRHVVSASTSDVGEALDQLLKGFPQIRTLHLPNRPSAIHALAVPDVDAGGMESETNSELCARGPACNLEELFVTISDRSTARHLLDQLERRSRAGLPRLVKLEIICLPDGLKAEEIEEIELMKMFAASVVRC